MITNSIRLYARPLERTDRHDDRHVGQRRYAATRLTAVPRDNISRRTRAARPSWFPAPCRSVEGMGGRRQLGQRSRDPVQAPDGLHLVGRAIRQHDGPPQSGDRRDEGVSAAEQRLAAHCRDRRQGQRLVHRQQERNGRLSRSQDREDSRSSRCRIPMRRIRTRWCSTRRASIWFTLQNSNMVGRLDPESGDIKLVTLKHAELKAVWHQDRRRRQSLVLLQRQPVSLQDQSGEHGADRGQACRSKAPRCGVSTSRRTG